MGLILPIINVSLSFKNAQYPVRLCASFCMGPNVVPLQRFVFACHLDIIILRKKAKYNIINHVIRIYSPGTHSVVEVMQ